MTTIPEVLKAGLELDRLIAERVMGWTYAPVEPLENWENVSAWFPKDKPGRKSTDTIRSEAPRWSRGIHAAWEVLEKFPAFIVHKRDDGETYWAVVFEPESRDWIDGPVAPTAPLAICLAALKAVEEPAHA